MNNVILMAVTQRFKDLSHVVTVKESAVFLGADSTHQESTPSQSRTIAKAVRDTSISATQKRVFTKKLSRAIKTRLVTSCNDFTPQNLSIF